MKNHVKLPPPVDPTHKSLTAALLDQQIAGTFRGKAYAYVPTMGESGKWRPGIAVANESGYNPIESDKFEFETDAACVEFCRGMNFHIGVPDDHAAAIVASTMGGFTYSM